MPHCRDCGNRMFFMSSQVSPPAPTATGPISGLVGRFDAGGGLVEMESLGADEKMRRKAATDPATFFDTCMKCGSTSVEW